MNTDDLPFFDSLTHPSLDGSWVSPKVTNANSFPATVASLAAANVRWAWAVAMGNSGPYEMPAYVRACADAAVTLLPAAYLDIHSFSNAEHASDWLRARRVDGFRGVKLHPRLGRFDFNHPWLPQIIADANRHGLIPFLCTYPYSNDFCSASLSIESLANLLRAVPNDKLVLLHAGAVRLLEVAEMTRHFKNVLLDLSYTLCEYQGSSVDLDLRFVLDRCRDRICIGSDSPEYTPSHMRARFEQLTHGFDRNHRERIAFRNMLRYSGLVENT
jgi:predicted TIM-barrel fold metal-dependent hydrolase